MSHPSIRCVLCCALVLFVAEASVADDEKLSPLSSPLPYQVIQRAGYNPNESHAHAVGGPQRGAADVVVSGRLTVPSKGHLECRTLLMEDAYGSAVDWHDIDAKIAEDGAYSGSINIPAGGWYRLEIRLVDDGGSANLVGAVEPIGVGEVFVIAGQSYACGANDELLKIAEPQGRVSAFDPIKNTWGVAHDPQPLVGDGGTIWPPLGDLLVPMLHVPIGFVNVAEGGTSSMQWQPGERLHARLLEAGKTTERFRAVLWQQGESDVIARTSTEQYAKNIRAIRASLADEWKFSPPWLLAKSTLHPTVYKTPEGEGAIRAAIDQLWHEPGFAPGPDTDLLDGPHRGPIGSRRHFSGLGQRQAAVLWFAAIWQELQFP